MTTETILINQIKSLLILVISWDLLTIRKHKRKLDDSAYLNNVDLFSGIAPDFKLLVVSLCVLSNADSAHLLKGTAKAKSKSLYRYKQVAV